MMFFRILLLAFAITSCSTNERQNVKTTTNTLEKQDEIKVGMKADALAEILGSPNMITTDSEGLEIWVYNKASLDAYKRNLLFVDEDHKIKRVLQYKDLIIVVKFDKQNRIKSLTYKAE
ncbi:MAG: hypothetical protein LBC92_01085 [Rickettsiales bacterium]|jgi:outer membrane protein assembly factor BamE (lipoprotein component of BamABCDE complex)|nr:hypothetical protein [Rickettsiales bacterium]